MTTEQYPLKRGTVNCPAHKKVPLHFEQIHGMRIIRDGHLHARCPECQVYYLVVPNGS